MLQTSGQVIRPLKCGCRWKQFFNQIPFTGKKDEIPRRPFTASCVVNRSSQCFYCVSRWTRPAAGDTRIASKSPSKPGSNDSSREGETTVTPDRKMHAFCKYLCVCGGESRSSELPVLAVESVHRFPFHAEMMMDSLTLCVYSESKRVPDVLRFRVFSDYMTSPAKRMTIALRYGVQLTICVCDPEHNKLRNRTQFWIKGNICREREMSFSCPSP